MRIITFYPVWIAIFLFWSALTGILFAYKKQSKTIRIRIMQAMKTAAAYSVLVAGPIFAILATITMLF